MARRHANAIEINLAGQTCYFPPDLGCELSPSCLDCPYPVCKFDIDPQLRRGKPSPARTMICVLQRTESLTATQIANRLGVHFYTAVRALEWGKSHQQDIDAYIDNIKGAKEGLDAE